MDLEALLHECWGKMPMWSEAGCAEKLVAWLEDHSDDRDNHDQVKVGQHVDLLFLAIASGDLMFLTYLVCSGVVQDLDPPRWMLPVLKRGNLEMLKHLLLLTRDRSHHMNIEEEVCVVGRGMFVLNRGSMITMTDACIMLGLPEALEVCLTSRYIISSCRSGQLSLRSRRDDGTEHLFDQDPKFSRLCCHLYWAVISNAPECIKVLNDHHTGCDIEHDATTFELCLELAHQFQSHLVTVFLLSAFASRHEPLVRHRAMETGLQGCGRDGDTLQAILELYGREEDGCPFNYTISELGTLFTSAMLLSMRCYGQLPDTVQRILRARVSGILTHPEKVASSSNQPLGQLTMALALAINITPEHAAMAECWSLCIFELIVGLTSEDEEKNDTLWLLIYGWIMASEEDDDDEEMDSIAGQIRFMPLLSMLVSWTGFPLWYDDDKSFIARLVSLGATKAIETWITICKIENPLDWLEPIPHCELIQIAAEGSRHTEDVIIVLLQKDLTKHRTAVWYTWVTYQLFMLTRARFFSRLVKMGLIDINIWSRQHGSLLHMVCSNVACLTSKIKTLLTFQHLDVNNSHIPAGQRTHIPIITALANGHKEVAWDIAHHPFFNPLATTFAGDSVIAATYRAADLKLMERLCALVPHPLSYLPSTELKDRPPVFWNYLVDRQLFRSKRSLMENERDDYAAEFMALVLAYTEGWLVFKPDAPKDIRKLFQGAASLPPELRYELARRWSGSTNRDFIADCCLRQATIRVIYGSVYLSSMARTPRRRAAVTKNLLQDMIKVSANS